VKKADGTWNQGEEGCLGLSKALVGRVAGYSEKPFWLRE